MVQAAEVVRGVGDPELADPEVVRVARAVALVEVVIGGPAGKHSESRPHLVHFCCPWGGLRPAPFVKFNPSKSFCA